MSNFLVIGNGFDRQIGLKTDYISFLDYLEESNYTELGLVNLISTVTIFTINQGFRIIPTVYLDALYEHKNTSTRELLKVILPNKQISNADYKYLKFYLLLLQTKENDINEKEGSGFNIWFSYFNFLRKLKSKEVRYANPEIEILFLNLVNEEGKWIDLESLIELNLRHMLKNPSFNSINQLTIFSFTWYLLLSQNKLWQEADFGRFREEINQLVWEHFIEFKKLLAEYLKKEEQKLKKIITTQKKLFNENDFSSAIFFNNRIINFNYTNTISLVKSKCKYHKNELQIYFLHGNINDLSNVVFGLDSYFRDLPSNSSVGKSDLEDKLLNDNGYVKYSKVHQLLNLQKEKTKFDIGIVDKLTIVGHSIGEQDYSYFFSMFDRNIENIEIEYLFYSYNSGKGDNKISGQDSLFNLLNAYEKYCSRRVLHKMIFEGRIKFKEVYIPKIVE